MKWVSYSLKSVPWSFLASAPPPNMVGSDGVTSLDHVLSEAVFIVQFLVLFWTGVIAGWWEQGQHRALTLEESNN